MYSTNRIRPTWVEINLDNLGHNMKEIKKNVKEGVLITAVVKANAYGHGSIKSAKIFLENGANRLAVAHLSEAIELRRANIGAPILILGYTPENQYDLLIKHNIIQTIYNYESAKQLSNLSMSMNKTATIHLKIDSGMGRIGFLPLDESIEEIIKIANLGNIEIEGIYTHFAKADERDKEYTRLQYKRFMEVVEKLEKKGIYIPIKHVANSAAIIDFPQYNLDMVRAGIILYGLYPSDEVDKGKMDLKPAMTLKSKISNIKKVPKGSGISYGQIYVTEKETKIATLPIGYGDGYSRMLTSKGQAYLKGRKVPVVGRICMDQSMLDVTDVEDVAIGDEVILFGYEDDNCPRVEDLAKKLNTINYEVVCMVGRRVPRVYIQGASLVDLVDYLEW